MQDLLLSIARCGEFEAAKADCNHPCHKIVSIQAQKDYQLPEPWNGNIESAQILYISSNPSYNPEEIFPNNSWSNEVIEQFFRNRFQNSYYTKTPYWTCIKKYTSWIIGIPVDDPTLPDRICIMEIVHCKSLRETGVQSCYKHCVQKWLNAILREFKGQYIVLLGRFAKEFENTIRLTGKEPLLMPHINARKVTDQYRKELIALWKKKSMLYLVK